MHRPNLILILILFLNLYVLSTVAQSHEESIGDSTAVKLWLSGSFSVSKPDSGFVPMEQDYGYIHAGINASIKLLSFPQKYHKVKSQYKNYKPSESSLFMDSITHNLSGLDAFTIIQEELSPDTNLYENYITLTTIVDFGEITVCIVGAYPKSKDKLLREKFIKTTLSVKEE